MDDTFNVFEEQVHAAIHGNPHLGRRSLRLEADQGRVTIHGVVDSYYQKQMAQEAVRNIDGVEHIENQLEVSWA